MKPGIRFKLFLGSLVLIGLSIAVAELYLSRTLENQLTERIRGELLIRAGLVAERVSSATAQLDSAIVEPLADTLGPASGARVTIVRPDGTVAGDSEVLQERLGRLENH